MKIKAFWPLFQQAPTAEGIWMSSSSKTRGFPGDRSESTSRWQLKASTKLSEYHRATCDMQNDRLSRVSWCRYVFACTLPFTLWPLVWWQWTSRRFSPRSVAYITPASATCDDSDDAGDIPATAVQILPLVRYHLANDLAVKGLRCSFNAQLYPPTSCLLLSFSVNTVQKQDAGYVLYARHHCCYCTCAPKQAPMKEARLAVHPPRRMVSLTAASSRFRVRTPWSAPWNAPGKAGNNMNTPHSRNIKVNIITVPYSATVYLLKCTLQ